MKPGLGGAGVRGHPPNLHFSLFTPAPHPAHPHQNPHPLLSPCPVVCSLRPSHWNFYLTVYPPYPPPPSPPPPPTHTTSLTHTFTKLPCPLLSPQHSFLAGQLERKDPRNQSSNHFMTRDNQTLRPSVPDSFSDNTCHSQASR